MLVQDLPGRAATISRPAIALFVLFDTSLGSRHRPGVPARWSNMRTMRCWASGPPCRTPSRACRTTSSWEILAYSPIVGVLAWAYGGDRGGGGVPPRSARRSWSSVLLGSFALVVVSHPPPIGPIGLACFAGAAGLLAISERTSRRVDIAPPTPASTPTTGVSNSIGVSATESASGYSASQPAASVTLSGRTSGSASSSTLHAASVAYGMMRLGRAPQPGGAGQQHRAEQRVPGGDGASEQRRQRPRPVASEIDRRDEERGGAGDQRGADDRGEHSQGSQPRIGRRLRFGDAPLAGDEQRHGDRDAGVDERPHPRRRVLPPKRSAWISVAASSVLASTHRAAGSVENVRQRVAVASTSRVASVPARKPAPMKMAFTGGEIPPRVVGVGAAGEQVKNTPLAGPEPTSS